MESNPNIVDLKEELTQKLEKKMQATYTIKQQQHPDYLLYDTATGQHHKV